MSIARSGLLEAVRRALRTAPVVALLGPRQCGKTTLALDVLASSRGERFDLEDPRDERRLEEPLTALEGLRGLVVIDEVQRRPGLFPVLRVLADRRPVRARFLVLGSASPELLRQRRVPRGEALSARAEGGGRADRGARVAPRLRLRSGHEIERDTRARPTPLNDAGPLAVAPLARA